MTSKTVPQKRRPVLVTSVRAEVLDGPDRGKQHTGVETMAIGTGTDNALVLIDGTVSRYHLEATAVSGGIRVVDLDSTNGTFASGIRIERATVPPGTVLRMGSTTLRLDEAAGKADAVPTPGAHLGIIAQSASMLKLLADIERIGPAPTSVLIVGESGTGKERFAEALHTASNRPGSVVTVDCGALASNLLASELFGHERGSFTGADRMHVGAFERAGDGTVFLDEIGELPLADQATLLGVLERRRFRRVGGTSEIALGARIVAATNRDLRVEVNHGRFRHDLYHRLAVVVLRIPPLRDRPEDIPPLIEHFARQLGVAGAIEDTFAEDLITRWQRRAWSGNVRELRNAVEAAVVAGYDVDGVAMRSPGDPPLPYKEARATNLASFERSYLTDLMERAEGNVSRGARLGKMDRSHLIEMLQRHGLRPST